MKLSLLLEFWNVPNATGYDEIPINVIKYWNEQVTTPLTKLINLSIGKGVFLELLKNLYG